MAEFTLAHAFTATWEGDLINHPSDPGGMTNYGISLRWLRGIGMDDGDVDGDGDIDADDIRALTFAQASELFRDKFWNEHKLSDLPQLVATCHYDCAVNMGPRQGTLITQRAYNRLVGPYGDKLSVDGVFGPKTRAFLTSHATPKLAETMISLRETFYRRLVENKPSLSAFEKGWLNRCRELRRFLGL